MIDLTIVTPVYNEEKNVEPFLDEIIKVLNTITDNYEIIFVLDPSTDRTEELIKNFSSQNQKIKLITLSRRFGQPSATIAGIQNSSGNRVVVIDVDLQDPPEIIAKMYNKMNEGYDVVYGKRLSREGETVIKKIFSSFGYRVINYMSEIYIPNDVGDFRMISKRVVSQLRNMNETHGFLRGLVSYVGFNQTHVTFDRKSRELGESKYNKFFGSLRIGLNGLIGFTSRPLQLMSILGFLFSFLSFLIGFIYLILKIYGIEITAGLPTTILVITFFSGIQLVAFGLLGEYISRIYDEVKNRPQYIIDEKINFDNK